MKKLLAVLLTLTMLVTLPAFGASAEKEVGGADGVLTFDPTTTGGKDLNVQVSEITHKYAVDITFSLNDLVIGGTIMWNVNTLKYDVKGATLADTTQSIEVKNRSDLPVYAFAKVTNTVDDNGITVTADQDDENNKLEIGEAKVGAGNTAGSATTKNIVISIKSGDWNAVAEYYAKKRLESTNQAEDTFKIATVTVTITQTKN